MLPPAPARRTWSFMNLTPTIEVELAVGLGGAMLPARPVEALREDPRFEVEGMGRLGRAFLTSAGRLTSASILRFFAGSSSGTRSTWCPRETISSRIARRREQETHLDFGSNDLGLCSRRLGGSRLVSLLALALDPIGLDLALLVLLLAIVLLPLLHDSKTLLLALLLERRLALLLLLLLRKKTRSVGARPAGLRTGRTFLAAAAASWMLLTTLGSVFLPFPKGLPKKDSTPEDEACD